MPRSLSPPEQRTAAGPTPADTARFPRIAGYRFQTLLGEGGMASVFLATQESLDRPVAIKVMERDALTDEISMQRFENEARTIAQLTHPSIVHIYEVGRTADGRMYYIMPYLSNGDLSQRDMRGKEDQVIEILGTLLSALEYAHARGIVHRDVKAGNVLFDVADRPLLTDFGIALSRRDKSRITSAGLAVGSSGYMAPEQARGDVVDGRADLYSVGVLAYELLTGRLPFRSPDALALALMHAQNPVPRLPPTKQHWQSFVNRAMAKSPDHRYHDATQMIEALKRVDRRTNKHFSGRFLRGYDKTVDGRIWKHPGTIALFGALLIAAGLYSERDRLPEIGTSAGSMQTHPLPMPAADSSISTQQVAALAADPAAKSTSTKAVAPSPAAQTKSQAIALPAASPVATSAAPTASPTTPSPNTAAAATTLAPPPLASTSTQTPKTSAADAPATAIDSSIAPDVAVLHAAHDALAHANLTAPADGNAIDLTMMAWKLSPATPANKQLASDVLAALARQQALAIGQYHDQRVLDYQQKAQQLADATIGRTTPAWRSLHTAMASALDSRVQVETTASDSTALKRTEALAKKLELSDVYAHSLASAQQHAQQLAQQLAQQKALAEAAAVRAANDPGPGFELLHGVSSGHPGTALARNEVTRQEYSQFVAATQHPTSECASKFAAAFGKHKSWSDPGFAQTPGQAAVCVSWADANAYVQWLSSRTGQHYRLPNVADWHEAGVAADTTAKTAGSTAIGSSHPDWLQDCDGDCNRHLVAGNSWQQHTAAAPTSHPGDRGFDDVGFRVVRVLDAHR